MIKEAGPGSVYEQATRSIPVDSAIKSRLIRDIRKLDDFPKIKMVVDDDGTLWDKWGVEIAWERTEAKSVNPDLGYILTWHGLYRGVVARCDDTHSHDIAYRLDFRTLTEASDEEYLKFERRIKKRVEDLETSQTHISTFKKHVNDM